MLGVGIIDDMNLGAADRGGVVRPIVAVLVQPQAGGINQVRRAVERAAQAATGLRHQCGKQCLEHHARAVCVGVGERRAGNLARAQVMSRPARLFTPATVSRKPQTPDSCPINSATN